MLNRCCFLLALLACPCAPGPRNSGQSAARLDSAKREMDTVKTRFIGAIVAVY